MHFIDAVLVIEDMLERVEQYRNIRTTGGEWVSGFEVADYSGPRLLNAIHVHEVPPKRQEFPIGRAATAPEVDNSAHQWWFRFQTGIKQRARQRLAAPYPL